MTSIQQSMNQMLGAVAGVATAGSYMARQTPGFKRKEELDRLATQRARLIEAGEQLSEQAGVEVGEAMDKKGVDLDPEQTKAWKAMKPTMEKELETARRQFELDPTEARAKDYAQLQKEYDLAYPEEAKAKAEENAVKRVETRMMTAREMLSALQQRKDLLSAKERGQIGTMAGRHKDKGGMDE